MGKAVRTHGGTLHGQETEIGIQTVTYRMSTMKKDKFDFSEEMDKVDRSIDTARRQEAEHDALEENLEALHELNGRTEELTGAFRRSVETFNMAVDELRKHSQALFSDKAKEEIAQEGERACKRMTDALERKGDELIAKFEKADKRISIPQATFCGLLFTLAVLTVFAVVICIYNESNHPDARIRTIAVCTLCVLSLGIAAAILVSRKLGNRKSNKEP